MTGAMLLLAASASLGAAQMTTYYDAKGAHPQCSEGPTAYIRDCVFPSDMFAYMLSAKPTLVDDNGTCASRGFTFVTVDPIFTGFKLYWMGGPAAFQNYSTTWAPAHPNLAPALNTSLNANPACAKSSAPTAAATAATAAALAVAAPRDDPTSVVFDADPTGYLQCSEGPASYLDACVQMSDLYAYFRMKQPTLVRNATCAGLGMNFKHISTDPIFAGFEMFYAGGMVAFLRDQGAWQAAHPEMQKFLGVVRDANPACSLP